MEDKTKAKIQELCPDVMPTCERCENAVPITSDFCKDGLAHLIQQRRITLAVVLRAMSKVGVMTRGANALINIIDVNAPDIRWNLEHDNYDQQSEETKRFIGELLGV